MGNLLFVISTLWQRYWMGELQTSKYRQELLKIQSSSLRGLNENLETILNQTFEKLLQPQKDIKKPVSKINLTTTIISEPTSPLGMKQELLTDVKPTTSYAWNNIPDYQLLEQLYVQGIKTSASAPVGITDGKWESKPSLAPTTMTVLELLAYMRAAKRSVVVASDFSVVNSSQGMSLTILGDYPDGDLSSPSSFSIHLPQNKSYLLRSGMRIKQVILKSGLLN